MLDRFGIRGKVLAVVAVPILVLILAAGFIVAQSAQSLSQARDAERVLDVLTSIHAVQDDFQAERWNSTNFVHSLQDGQNKLSDGYASTDTALEDIQADLDALAAEPEVTAEGPSVEEITAEINSAIGRSDSGDYLLAQRSVTIGAPTEESGGWVTFPAEDEIAGMQDGYAAAAEQIDALSESLPEEYDLSVPLAALAFRVNNEATLATALFTEPQTYLADLQTSQAAVNSSVQQLGVDSSLLQVNAENEQAIAVLAEAEEALADLPQVRQSVMNSTGNVSFLTNYYTGVIDATVRSTAVVSVTMGNPDIVSRLQAYGDLDLLLESMLFEETVTQRLIRAGTFLPGEEAQVRTMTTRTDIALDSSQQANSGIEGAPEVPGYGASAGDVDGTADSFVSVRTQVLTGLDASLVGLRDADWPAQVDAEAAVYTDLRTEMWGEVEGTASSARNSAVLQTVVTAIAAIVIIGLSLLVALLIARRIVGPMRRLTTTATAVRTELPRLVERVAVPGEDVDVSEVQIPVESQDEVGRLAEAFNSVNATTLSIAAEQAALRGSISEMFVNVARRDQVLLNRQLASIDDMERTEDDPDTLTKLFALDHLATRMRRNSESLLVLAGIDTGRRLRRPMPLSDVVRTASSEIELYERVDLDLHDDPAMLGHAALSTAHLFAELLENATVFSDPGSPVVVRTSRQDDHYVVEVIDGGIGMTESELAQANGRVGSTAASEILGAQRLGLFVVGRIARRVGASVQIASQEGEGTVATVLLPASLFVTEAELPGDSAPAPASAPAQSSSAPEPARSVAPPTGAAAPAALAGAAYAPAAMEEGASLTGRGGDDMPTRGTAAPAGDGNSIDDLIAADAAAAPQAEPANIEELTEGSSDAGLPTRRRRSAPDAADAERERTSVVGLPARATDAQLSALAAEANDSFMPSVPAAEIAPQSAEERASMFRGFRSRRETEGEMDASASPLPSRRKVESEPEVDDFAVPGLEDDSPAHGGEGNEDESGFGAGAAAGAAAAGAAAFSAAAFFGGRDNDAAPSQPSTQADEPAAESAPEASEYVPAQEAIEDEAPAAPEPQPEPEPTYDLEPDAAAGVAGFRMPKFDAATTGQFAAIRDDEPAPEPYATAVADEAPFVPGAADSAPEAEASPFDSAPEPAQVPVWARTEQETQGDAEAFVVPTLEDDEEYPAPAVDESPAPNPFAPVFAAEDALVADEPETEAEFAQQPEMPAEPSPFAPSAEVPSFEEPAAVESPAPAEDQGPFPFSAPQPKAPEPVQEYSAPEAAVAPAPWTRSATPASAASAAPVAPNSADSPQLDALIQSAVEDDHQPGFFSRLFGRGKSNAEAAPPVQESPASAAPVFTPVTGAAPAPQAPEAEPAQAPAEPASEAPTKEPQRASFMPAAPQPEASSAPEPWAQSASTFEPEPEPQPAAPSQPSVSSFEPAPQAFEPAPQAFAPAPQSFEPDPAPATEQQAPAADAFGDSPASFTPDDLARATGWEAAGQNALQASEPEPGGGYQPIIQPEPLADDEPDMTSAVFSELSSLAAERPKVEKTRAGLQKRRPASAPPVEVKPLEAEPQPQGTGDAPERDADAVRERFSSFYSGTQRARSDVEAMDQDPSNPGSGH
ncbi:ATP-binding protein [Demequina flava]|uniref:ATP-binding protein n=1 Tax=Demequina flava TaxID=1095025 RepID=UPI000784120D|nr:ATP-binding protein [Demequina flava]